MGAVKNHFHDEICARADEDRDGPDEPVSNARMIAELQAVAIGIRLVGLAMLPSVMGPRAKGDQS